MAFILTILGGIGSALGSLGSLLWKLIFGDREKKRLEKELAEKTTENIELKSEAAGQQVEREIEKEEAAREAEWAEVERANDTRRKYEILKRDFDNGDSD